MAREIKLTLTFTEDDLNQVLAYSFVGDGDAPTVADLTEGQFAQLDSEMQSSASSFVEEIVEASGEGSEWLFDFMEQFNDEEEDDE